MVISSSTVLALPEFPYVTTTGKVNNGQTFTLQIQEDLIYKAVGDLISLYNWQRIAIMYEDKLKGLFIFILYI